MPKLLIIIILLSAVACGRDVSKKFPGSNDENNSTTGANNGTVGTNNVNNGTTNPNNGTTSPNNSTTTPNNVTTPPANNTANNVTTNNATANNNTNNQTTPPGPSIAYISGQAQEFDAELVLANYAFVHVGGDEEPLLADMRDFWLGGDADRYDIVVVEWGFHNTNLGANYPQDGSAVSDAARLWVENGGLLLDLSGGLSYDAFPSFYTLNFALVQPGTYTAFAQDASLPYAEFAWSKADDDRNMAGINTTSIDPADGEALLVDSTVTTCDFTDLACANPMPNQPTAMFISKQVGQGMVYHGNWVSPLDDQVVETVLSVLPAP